jgi:hypothetical protein
MRKMRICLLAIAAARLFVLAPDSANAQALQAQAVRNRVALSQQARQAHAESSMPA